MRDNPRTEEEHLFDQLFSENDALITEQSNYDYPQNMLVPYGGPQVPHQYPSQQFVDFMNSNFSESNTSSIVSIPQQTNVPLNSEINLQKPLMMLNLEGHSGDINYGVSIPRQCGKNKWTYSHKLGKLYAGRDIPFPVKLSFPRDVQGSVVICPVFEDTSMRFYPVRRCPNCSLSDKSSLEDHLVRVSGSECSYMKHGNRHVVEVPLHSLSLDESSMTVFLGMSCRTSCLGGPNRHLFALLFTFLDANRGQLSSDVLHVKCCESPFRDLKHELKIYNSKTLQEAGNDEQIARISSSLTRVPSKKRKLEVKSEKNYVESIAISVPRKFARSVRRYVNLLYCQEQMGGKINYFSHTDTE